MNMEVEFLLFKNRLMNAVSNTCETEIAQVIGEMVSQSVHRNVYDKYETDSYRRMDAGGLSDTENLTSSTERSDDVVILTIRNETPFQVGGKTYYGSTLSEVVQDGKKGFHMPFPRPYMEIVEKEIGGAAVESALHSGLIRNGII